MYSLLEIIYWNVVPVGMSHVALLSSSPRPVETSSGYVSGPENSCVRHGQWRHRTSGPSGWFSFVGFSRRFTKSFAIPCKSLGPSTTRNPYGQLYLIILGNVSTWCHIETNLYRFRYINLLQCKQSVSEVNRFLHSILLCKYLHNAWSENEFLFCNVR